MLLHRHGAPLHQCSHHHQQCLQHNGQQLVELPPPPPLLRHHLLPHTAKQSFGLPKLLIQHADLPQHSELLLSELPTLLRLHLYVLPNGCQQTLEFCCDIQKGGHAM
jgi:hypothetical protein